MQHLEHDGRRRTIGGALRQARGQGAACAAAGDGQPAGVDTQRGSVGGYPVQYGHRVIERRRVRVFGSESVVEGDDGAPTAPGQLKALTVVGIEVAEYESTGVAIDHRRCWRRAAPINAHGNRRQLAVLEFDANRVDIPRGLCAPLVQRVTDDAQHARRQVGTCRREVAQRGIESLHDIDVGVHRCYRVAVEWDPTSTSWMCTGGSKVYSAGRKRRVIPQNARALRGHWVTTRPLGARK